jgi:hypothetical protein
MNAPFSIEPEPIAIEPRACGLCGLTIDRHEMIGEGPVFFCSEFDDFAADIMRRCELADPRDSWQHTGELPPPAHVRNSDISPRPADRPQSYRTPQATKDAFWFVVGLADPGRLKAWLADHPKDARFLIKLLESK